jgi:hypothetical protein
MAAKRLESVARALALSLTCQYGKLCCAAFTGIGAEMVEAIILLAEMGEESLKVGRAVSMLLA